MDFENMNIWCWLIPTLVGIICGILGYLIGKRSAIIENNATELKSLQIKNSKLQEDLVACAQKMAIEDKSEKRAANLGASVSSFTTGAASNSGTFDKAKAKSVFGKTIKADDLKVIEGIGPKIEEMFYRQGIKTWKSLSEASVAECQKVLDTGGKRYQIHDPASWPMQAKMCYEGKWNDLFKWQEVHKHGKL